MEWFLLVIGLCAALFLFAARRAFKLNLRMRDFDE